LIFKNPMGMLGNNKDELRFINKKRCSISDMQLNNRNEAELLNDERKESIDTLEDEDMDERVVLFK
jgi:hypothetical protein